MRSYEVEVNIHIKGYENIRAVDKREATRYMREALDKYVGNLPLVQKSMELKVEIKGDGESC